MSVTVKNVYGIYADFTTWPDAQKMAEMDYSGESLAAHLIFKDRIIKIDWNGRIEVEPT